VLNVVDNVLHYFREQDFSAPPLSLPPLLSPVAFGASHLKIFEIGTKKESFFNLKLVM